MIQPAFWGSFLMKLNEGITSPMPDHTKMSAWIYCSIYLAVQNWCGKKEDCAFLSALLNPQTTIKLQEVNEVQTCLSASKAGKNVSCCYLKMLLYVWLPESLLAARMWANSSRTDAWDKIWRKGLVMLCCSFICLKVWLTSTLSRRRCIIFWFPWELPGPAPSSASCQEP